MFTTGQGTFVYPDHESGWFGRVIWPFENLKTFKSLHKFIIKYRPNTVVHTLWPAINQSRCPTSLHLFGYQGAVKFGFKTTLFQYCFCDWNSLNSSAYWQKLIPTSESPNEYGMRNMQCLPAKLRYFLTLAFRSSVRGLGTSLLYWV